MSAQIHIGRLPAAVKNQMSRLDMPGSYAAAVRAVQACAAFDELKDWDNKCAAMAAYANQIRDSSLHDAAQRIRLRARARLGELLADLRGPSERRDIAAKIGLRRGEITHNMMLARVPSVTREALIEQSPVPNFGVFRTHDPKYLEGIKGVEQSSSPETDAVMVLIYKLWASIQGAPRAKDSAMFVAKHCGFDANDLASYRKEAIGILEWLDEFERFLPKERAAP